MHGGPLPDWPDDPWRWDERFGGLPYLTVMANRFLDFMAGFEAAHQRPADRPADITGQSEAMQHGNSGMDTK